MDGLRGFGIRFDAETGACRNWYIGTEGVQRWADNDEPVEDDSPRYTITDKGREMRGGGA